MVTNKFFRFVFVFLLLARAKLALRRRLKFQLQDHQIFCLHQQFFDGMNVYTDFYVIKGQIRDILFYLKNPLDDLLYNQVVTDGRFQFPIDKNGSYTFCFDNLNNNDSASYDKRINFYISTNDNFQDPDFLIETDAKSHRSDEMENELEETVKSSFDLIENHIGEIYYLQDSVSNHAKYDMYVIERIIDRVNFWSTLNSIIIVVSCFFQVFFIRSLFNRNKFNYHQNRPSANIEPYIVPHDDSYIRYVS